MPPVQRNLQLCYAARSFVPERLQLARELRHMTRTNLAARTGVSAASVAQYELGANKPDTAVLARLCLALAVPLPFFARPGHRPIASEVCHFRHLRPAQQAARRAQLALADLLADVLEFAQTQVVFPSSATERPAIAHVSFDDVDTSAMMLRRSWGLGLDPIVDLTRMCEINGIVVHPIHAANVAVQPFSVHHRGWPMVFYVEQPNAADDVRFDKAHELGHLVMHADARAAHPRAEREADTFARAFLLPGPVLTSDFPRTLDWPRLYGLAASWGVSMPVLLQRAHELNCLSEPLYRRGLAVWKEGGAPQRRAVADDAESPSLLRRAFALIAEDWPLIAIAHELGLLPGDLATVAGLHDIAC